MNSGMNDNDSRPQDKLPVAITFFLISGDDTVKTCGRKRCCIYRSGLSHYTEVELNFTNWSEHQKGAFIKMQSAAQLADYKTKCPGARFHVIIYNKKDAGRFFTCETENDIRLLDITILPEFTGKGSEQIFCIA